MWERNNKLVDFDIFSLSLFLSDITEAFVTFESDKVDLLFIALCY